MELLTGAFSSGGKTRDLRISVETDECGQFRMENEYAKLVLTCKAMEPGGHGHLPVSGISRLGGHLAQVYGLCLY
jgi:hypothetical protein